MSLIQKCIYGIVLFCLFNTYSQLNNGDFVDDGPYIPYLYLNPVPIEFMGEVASSYYIRTFMGTPPQPLNAILDGGLDLFNVYGEDCTEYPCQKSVFYNSLSYTYEVNGTALNYTYGGGAITVTGNVSTDAFSMSGMSVSPFEFGLISKITEPAYFPNVSSTPINAVFGFAYPTAEWGGLSLVKQFNGFSEHLNMTICLSLPDSIYKRGQISIGGADPSLYTPPIHYVPLLPSTWAQKDYLFFWSNVVDDVLVNGVSTGVCTKKVCNFFIDLAGKPMDLANAAPAISVNPNCANLSDLPTITLIINQIAYDFPPEDYVIEYVKDGAVQCESGISSGGHILYPFTLGYTFIRNFYTCLDYENKQIGFATYK